MIILIILIIWNGVSVWDLIFWFLKNGLLILTFVLDKIRRSVFEFKFLDYWSSLFGLWFFDIFAFNIRIIIRIIIKSIQWVLLSEIYRWWWMIFFFLLRQNIIVLMIFLLKLFAVFILAIILNNLSRNIYT